MASIKKRNNKFCVIYKIKDENGKSHQKWETYDTKAEADRRKKEIEYKMAVGSFEIPKCTMLKELLEEYVRIYGCDKWSVSTYDGNVSLIRNYINPIIGNTKISEINTYFLEKYYLKLLETPAVESSRKKKGEEKMVSASTVNDIHKLLRSCFRQGKKWGMLRENPAIDATVPKHKKEKREIWTAEVLMAALESCENEMLRLALHMAFAGSLRIGELIGLTWDCVDISEEAITENRAYIYINKEVERVSKKAVEELNGKDIILIFPSTKKNNKTVRVLKVPKTESSIRKVFLPTFVALQLAEWKKQQDETKEVLGDEYQDFNLVMATTFGLPVSDSYIREKMKDLIEKNDLPPVVFHSLRHTSVTYKLKLNGGDIKAVQGDSGHSQADMVTEVYSHIIDEDRRKTAELFENAFYKKENLNPQLHENTAKNKTVTLPEGIDAELIMKVFANPEMAALITSLAKSMQGQ